jgi:aspartate aminotransferase
MSFISTRAKNAHPSPTLSIDAKFKEMKAEGLPVLGFGAGEPDFDTPENIKNAGIDAIKNNFTKYTPASGILKLKEAICAKFLADNDLNYAAKQILVSCGAKHSLTNIFLGICDPGGEIIIPAPYWVSYPEMVSLAGGVPKFIETSENSGFKITAADLEKAITPKTRGIVLNSPSNPTGAVYTKAELEALAEVIVKHGIYVISDEIYEKLVYGVKHVSIASLGDEIKDLAIIVNGVSKSYAMTGWRIGYLAGPENLVKAMSNVQSHQTSNPTSIAQYAALEALTGDQSSIEKMRAEYEKRRNFMVDRINSIDGLSCLKPDGAFYVFMNVSRLLGREFYGKKINKASELCEDILARSMVALVPSEGFGINGYARLSFATDMDTIKNGLDRIEKYIKGEAKK